MGVNNVMQKITFINARGESVEIGYQFPFFLNKIEGLGDVDAEIQTSKSPFQDGSEPIDVLMNERVIPIEMAILKNFETNRQILSRIFNPKLGEGLLIYENGFVKRQIRAISEHVPKYPDERPRQSQKAIIDLFCANPYWEDINPTNVKLEDFVSNFSFPFSFPVSFATRGDTRTLINEGDVPTPVKITFRGESVNPKITKLNTGETLRIKRTIPDGYSLVITTDFNNKSVQIIAPDGVKTDAMGYIDLDLPWSFFSLDVGENQLSFITEGGKPDVFIEYKNLYVGV